LVLARFNSAVRSAAMNPATIATIRNFQRTSAECPILYPP
jgi:hypothetical protein